VEAEALLLRDGCVKAHRVRKGRTEPEGQVRQFTGRTGVFGWAFKERIRTKGAIVSFCSPCGMVLPALVFVFPVPVQSLSSCHGTAVEKGTLQTLWSIFF